MLISIDLTYFIYKLIDKEKKKNDDKKNENKSPVLRNP